MKPDPSAVRRQLIARRAELSERLARIRHDLTHQAAPLAADPEDRAQEEENDEVLAALELATASLLAQSDRALARLEAGHREACEVCGFGIEPGRFARQLDATRCEACTRAVA